MTQEAMVDESKERRGDFLMQLATLVHQEATAATLETQALAAIPQAARTAEQVAQAAELVRWLRGVESVALVAGVLIADQGAAELQAATPARPRAPSRAGEALPATRARAPRRRRAKPAPK